MDERNLSTVARAAASATTDSYVAALQAVAPGQIAAVYAVGSLALGDFSDRQSNIDLVVVADPGLDASQLRRVSPATRGLHRARRDAEVWHVTWSDLDAGGPGSAGEHGGAPTGTTSPLATPLTRAILRHDPMALFGPDWPVVGHDPEYFQQWAAARLRGLVARDHGLLVWRRAVVPLVLEAARLTQAAITGRVLSKSEAGESAMSIVSTREKRLLTDAVGYRRGARTSMYWGPFERKYDAVALLRDLLEAATGQAGLSPDR
jgi:hypothetical protein